MVFDSIVNKIVDALYRLKFTAASHALFMGVPGMGQYSGHLACHGEMAGGANCILLSEIAYSIENLFHKISKLRHRWGR